MSAPRPRPMKIWRIHLFGMRTFIHPRLVSTTIILTILLIIAAAIVMTRGTIPITAQDIIRTLTAPDNSLASNAILSLRLPKVITAAATGACLGIAGLLFQSLSRNALGSPEIIGVVTGAAFGAVIGVIILGTHGWATALSAVIGCLIATSVGYLLTATKTLNVTRFLLVGIGLSAWWSALTTLVLTRSDPDIGTAAHMWLVGSLNARTWEHAIVSTVPLLLLIPFALLLSRHLAVMELGVDMATSIGVNLKKTGLYAGLVGVILTACGIAATGPISFISLTAPHLAFALGGVRTPPIITSALCGSLLLVSSELAMSYMPSGLSAPVGIATSVLGGIYLIIVVLRRPR
ncbi:MAG: iron chelate uptake ABC transporter family permease subunit [Actinomycetaceae bacterium]|nr:iron chelate uptake ABC transporter family permease subunit [Actinomycetaceae bacterium]